MHCHPDFGLLYRHVLSLDLSFAITFPISEVKFAFRKAHKGVFFSLIPSNQHHGLIFPEIITH